MSIQWLIEEGDLGPRMTMFGAWSPAALAAATQGGVRELTLNYAKGWTGTYGLLSELPELRALDITDWNATDVTPIHTLSKLQRLKIFTYCKSAVDFARFPDLQQCVLEWRPKARSIFEHAGLKDVFINHLPDKDLKAFSRMRLQKLRLASPRLERLDGISALGELKFLGIYVARRLASLDGLQRLEHLTHLEVNSCKRIGNISALAELTSLEKVHLCNDGDLASLAPLSSHQGLKVVLFSESTNIIDGDLSVLERLPNLENTSLMNRRHYSHRREALPTRPST